MEDGLILLLSPHPLMLLAAVILDLGIGDPVYAAHPIRLMGWTLTRVENGLRAIGLSGYTGGILLFVVLACLWLAIVTALLALALLVSPIIGWAVHVFVLYSLLALGDLLVHVNRIERAAATDNIAQTRAATARLVGRDTAPMDIAACRRAGIESLSESLPDGFISALFWYVLLGLPGIVIFKIVSTMDSMVGYRSPRYLRFGWCGARADDAMNYIPARLSMPLLALAALVIPGCSVRKTVTCALRQHGALPSPNSGWSEAATAGAIQRRLVGPIYRGGELVTDIWIGDPSDPPAATGADMQRAIALVVTAALLSLALAEAAFRLLA